MKGSNRIPKGEMAEAKGGRSKHTPGLIRCPRDGKLKFPEPGFPSFGATLFSGCGGSKGGATDQVPFFFSFTGAHGNWDPILAVRDAEKRIR